MSNEIMRQELKEAIDAGERALSSLYSAQDNLKSASNWGLFDMFGGGLISTMAKRSKMQNAASYMEDAKSNLRRFQRELQDVNVSLDLNMDIGGFLSFADYFFDGFIADYLVQSKISDARSQVDHAIHMVRRIVDDLRVRYGGE